MLYRLKHVTQGVVNCSELKRVILLTESCLKVWTEKDRTGEFYLPCKGGKGGSFSLDEKKRLLSKHMDETWGQLGISFGFRYNRVCCITRALYDYSSLVALACMDQC